VPRNTGRLIGQTRLLPTTQARSIRARLALAGNLRAVRLLLGPRRIFGRVRYPGVELGDALSIAERTDV